MTTFSFFANQKFRHKCAFLHIYSHFLTAGRTEYILASAMIHTNIFCEFEIYEESLSIYRDMTQWFLQLQNAQYFHSWGLKILPKKTSFMPT